MPTGCDTNAAKEIIGNILPDTVLKAESFKFGIIDTENIFVLHTELNNNYG
jgi:hypothetical protein